MTRELSVSMLDSLSLAVAPVPLIATSNVVLAVSTLVLNWTYPPGPLSLTPPTIVAMVDSGDTQAARLWSTNVVLVKAPAMIFAPKVIAELRHVYLLPRFWNGRMFPLPST